MQKPDIRKAMIAQRLTLTQPEKLIAAQHVTSRTTNWLATQGLLAKGNVMALYMPHQGELNTMPLMEIVTKKGLQLALPAMQPGHKMLTFRSWSPGEPLLEAAYGIMQPEDSKPQLKPDIICVPLVAADRQRHRLGYGGGFYDTTLAALSQQGKAPITIGLAYDFQLIDKLPSQPHDQQLTTIITTSETVTS